MDNTDTSIFYDSANYIALKDTEHQTADLYLSHCGMEHCHPDQAYPDTLYSDYIILFVLSGCGKFSYGARTFMPSAGQAILLLADRTDYILKADHDDPWTYMWIGFNGSQATLYLQHTGLSAEQPICDIHVPMDGLCSLTQDLLNTKTLTMSNEIKRVGYLYRLFSLLVASQLLSQPRRQAHEHSAKTYALYAEEYIKTHYNQANITDIANQIGIDRSYLHTIFKKHFLMSPQEYLISYRLKIASSLLKSTSLTIQQIAQEIGYEDSLQFSKIFKKHYDMSPKSYRQLMNTERIF